MQVEEPRSFWLPVAGMAAGTICGAAGCILLLAPGRRDDLWIGALIASLPIMLAGVMDWWWTRRHVRAALRDQIAADQAVLEKEKHDLSARCARLDKENNRLHVYEQWLKERDERISKLDGQLRETESRLRENERKLGTYRSGYARLSADPDSVVDLDQKMQELEATLASRDAELGKLRADRDAVHRLVTAYALACEAAGVGPGATIDLRAQIDAMRAQAQDLEARKKELEARIEELASQQSEGIARMNAEIADREARCSELSRRAEELRRDVDELQKAKEAAQQDLRLLLAKYEPMVGMHQAEA